MGYRIVIVTRENDGKLESIAFEAERDFINEALEEVQIQVNGLIPKKCIEAILIEKV